MNTVAQHNQNILELPRASHPCSISLLYTTITLSAGYKPLSSLGVALKPQTRKVRAHAEWLLHVVRWVDFAGCGSCGSQITFCARRWCDSVLRHAMVFRGRANKG